MKKLTTLFDTPVVCDCHLDNFSTLGIGVVCFSELLSVGGGPHIALHSLCPSVCPSVPLLFILQ